MKTRGSKDANAEVDVWTHTDRLNKEWAVSTETRDDLYHERRQMTVLF